jgi:mono/diheme cytochrome c family protein
MFRFTTCCALLLATSLATVVARGEEASQLFKSKVQPLLQTKCFGCHSEKAEEVKGGLKLDTLDDILKGGPNGPAVTPGDTMNSFLLRAIRYEEADFQMPPSGKLSDEEIEMVEQWVRSMSSTTSRQVPGQQSPNKSLPGK